ncbi:MAG: YciI family protein [Proteobacteria bacterium]|nr:YciI family protein [Pseudomonadota bacterium]
MSDNTNQRVADLTARNLARKEAGEKTGKMYWAVHTQWAEGLDKDDAPLPEHLAYQLMLEETGVLFAAGGLTDGPSGERAGGLIVIRAPSYERAMEIATEDPMHKSGFRHFNLYRWRMNEGHIRFTVNLSTGQGEME